MKNLMLLGILPRKLLDRYTSSCVHLLHNKDNDETTMEGKMGGGHNKNMRTVHETGEFLSIDQLESRTPVFKDFPALRYSLVTTAVSLTYIYILPQIWNQLLVRK